MKASSIDSWNQNGFGVFEDLIKADELELLRQLYNDFLNGVYNLDGLRSDLSGGNVSGKQIEKITQIMRPSLVVDDLMRTETYSNVISNARKLLGEDMEIDFDMMIDKAPGTDTITPWHQDAAYWPDMPDQRAVSFWLALDDTDQENGCMMYVPGSHLKGLRPHVQPTPNAALQCVVENEIIWHGNISAGTGIAHHGLTLHGALGNRHASKHRRALIINLRPSGMIVYLRSLGYDHLGKREIKNENSSTQ